MGQKKLTGFDKVLGAVSPKWALQRVMARDALHEFAAVRPSGARGKPATIFDQGSSESWRKQRERVDAMMEAREMEECFCIIAGLLQKIGMYAFGQVEYQPETGDAKADEEYEQYFHDWCGRADITGRHRLRTLVQLGFQSALRDGEHGFQEHIVNGELRLQAIEGDRIGGANQGNQGDEKNINGIKIDDKGRVIGYEIYRRTRTVKYELEGEVTPENFIHLFFPKRTDQYHGVSVLAPALPHARDLYELLGHEKIAAKFAAAWTAIVRTRDPGAPGAMQWSENPQGSNLPQTMAAQPGMMLKLEQGVEDIEFAPGTQRPSGAFMALVDALIREIALAIPLPYGFVYNMAAFGGVTARLETESAQRVFRWYQEIVEHIMLNRVKRKVLLLGIAAGKIKGTKHWNRGSWRYGATLTGDVGHAVQADLDLMRAGAKPRSQLASNCGNDFRQVMEKKGAEIKIAMEVSRKTGAPIELLLPELVGATEQIAALKRAKDGVSDTPPPPPGLIGSVGEKAVKGLLDLVMAVNKGEMDRDSAVQTAMTVYGMDPMEADSLFPG